MLSNLSNTLFLDLAEMLKGNKVDTEAVVRSLKLLCNRLLFDCGLVYEVDDTGDHSIKEHYTPNTDVFPQTLAKESLFSQEWKDRIRDKVVYIKKDAENTSLENQWLDTFSAESFLIAPIADDDFLENGLVLFLNTTPKPEISKAEMKTIDTLLSLLTRYIGMRMYQNKLMKAQISLEMILDNTGIDIYVNDFYTHEILYANKSMAAPYGGKNCLIGEQCWRILFPGQKGPCDFCPQKKLIDEDGLPTKIYSWDYQRPFDGSWFRVFSAAFKWKDGRLAHIVSSADITDNKRNEEMIEYLANYDPLTNLPNRRMLVSECEQRINKSTITERGYVLFFDIDGFKTINDQFGHDAGDEFLVKLGEFFSSIPLLKDSIYRNGGDEFVAIIGGETIEKDNITSLAHFIHERFKKPWKLKNGDVFCSASIGVACYPEDGNTPELLIQKADKAMYHVKKSGGAGLCFGYQLENSLN